MTFCIRMCLVLILFVASASAQASTAKGNLPPLIDRELFFGNPEITNASLSPDGKLISFLKPWNGTINLWVKKINEPFTAARRMTSQTKRPISESFWSRDGKVLGYSQDADGDENFHVFAVDPAANAAAGSDVPPSRDLTPMKSTRARFCGDCKQRPGVVFIGLNDRDPAWHDLYELEWATGKLTLLNKNTEHISVWTFDRDGHLRMATRTTPIGETELLRVDDNQFTKIYGCSAFETCDVLRFHKDGKRVFIVTNHGDDVNLTTLSLLDIQTGKTELVESDPLGRVDLQNATFSEATDELVGTYYNDEKTRRYFTDKEFEADQKWLEEKMPGLQVDMISSSDDDQLWLVLASGDTEPGETWLFDRRKHELTEQFKSRENLPRESLTRLQPITYKSSDGLEIPAYLTLPLGVEAKNLPLLVYPHGGPWARDSWGYNRGAQFFANRGYAVLIPNFRGSTGYGKKFLNAGNREWGLKMQDDITWGVKDLINRGIADPKRVGITGISYGGYATLAGVTVTPDLYAAAVEECGPSDLISLLDAFPPYWQSMRQMFYTRMGDPRDPAGKALLKAASPLNLVDKIHTPLMVVQGENDPRVKKAQAQRIVIALRDRHFPVQYILAPDEGHGFSRPVNNMAMLMATEKFLSKYLGGRYQEGGTPEVVARLKEISVDPATVK